MIKDFREKANKDYKTIKGILDKHGVKFFALCGTALGAVRDGDFIEWDDDLDLASIQPVSYEKKQQVIADFRIANFEVTLRNPDPDGNLWFERNVTGDLYFLNKVGNNYVYRLDDGKEAIKIPEKYIKCIKRYSLGDSSVLVPNPPGQYLAATYDEDYLTIKKDQIGRIILKK